MENELVLLENELLSMLDNIKRVREYKLQYSDSKYKPYNSNVIGELRHRCVSLKSRLTIVSKFSTVNLFKK